MSVFDGVDFFKGAPADPGPSEFGKGIRSGGLSLGANVANATGAISNRLGFRDFGASAFAAADDLNQRAAAAAPRVTSVRSIGAPGGQGMFNDAVDWAAGTLGGVIPSAALGIGAAMAAPASAGLLGGMAAGTAAYALPEVGEVVGRQREQGMPVDLGTAGAAGLGSAALGSVVPGLVGAKLAGRAVGGAPLTLRSGGRTLAAEAGLEGATEAGGEVSKQLGSGNTLSTLDGGQLVDSFAGGVVGGGAMSGVGLAGQYAQEKAADVSAGLDGAKNATTDLLDRAAKAAGGAARGVADAAKPVTDAAGNVAGQVGEKLDGFGFFDDLSSRWDDTKLKAKDMLRKVAESEDVVGDAKAFATASKDKLQSMFADDDGKRAAAVRKVYEDLSTENLSPENKAVLDEWAANPGDRAKQAAVASLKLATDKAKDVRTKLKGVADRIVAKADEQLAAKTGPKKSEDFSGADMAIMREITPLLQEAHPELFKRGQQDALMDAGRAIRGLLTELSSGRMPSSDTVAELIDVLGPKATDMIEAGYRVVGASEDKGKTAAFFKGLNEIVDAKKASDDMVGALRKQLKPEYQKLVSDGELAQEARTLTAWATSSRKSGDDPQFAYNDRKQREALKTRYQNPEAVMAAAEARIPKADNQIERARPMLDEEGNVLGEKGGLGLDREVELAGQKLQLHLAKNELMYLHPDHDPGRGGNLPAVSQRMARVKSEGGAAPRMLTADELGMDHPLVQRTYKELVRRGEMAGIDAEAFAAEEIKKYVAITTEVSDSPQSISPDELREMTLNTKRYGKSPSRLNTTEDGPILDGTRVQRFMQNRFKDEYAGNDNKSRIMRMGRMFVEGVAAVQDHLGVSFPVPDSVVIGRLGGQDITFGEARKYDVRTAADVEYDNDTAKLTALRAAFRKASGQDPKTGKQVAPKPANAEEFQRQALAQDKVLEKARNIVNKRDFAKTVELGQDSIEPDDATEFGSETNDGLALNKARMREIEAELEGLEKKPNSPNRRKRERELMEEFGQLSLGRNTTTAAQNRNKDRNSGQREIDPFGQIHQAAGFNERRNPVPFQQAGGAEAGMGDVRAPSLLGTRRARAAPAETSTDVDFDDRPPDDFDEPDEFRDGSAEQVSAAAEDEARQVRWINRMAAMPLADAKALIDKLNQTQLDAMTNAMEDLSGPPEGVTRAQWRQLLGHAQQRSYNQEAPPDPKVVAAKKAALLEKARSGDAALLKTLASSNDAAGLQRAVMALAEPDAVKLDEALAAENYGHLNTRAKVDAFLAAAKTRYAELKAEDRRVLNDDDHPTGKLPETQMRALATLESMFGKDAKVDIESFYDGVDDAQAAIDAANGRLAELVRDDPDAAYQLQTQRYSAQSTAPGAAGPINRQEVRDYLTRVLGPKIRLAWRNFAHAGEFERVDVNGSLEDVVRISIHSLNPLSVAHHEALHGFFERLRDMQQGQIMDVLERAAMSAPVQNQLKKLLANEPAAIKQLGNPEEAAAYMYQFWSMRDSNGQRLLNIGGQTENVFQRIATFIRSVLGIWSNDARALHILEYFHAGDFAKDASKPFAGDVIAKKLMAPGRNSAVEAAKKMTHTFRELGESLAVAGGQRLRDTGIPALRELADAMKLHGTSEGDDPGFLPAARAERAKVMNDLAAKLKGFSEASISAAMESLQTKSNAPITALTDQTERGNAMTAKIHVRKMLDDMYRYMQSAGVAVNDLGVGKDYFPRQYNASFISSHTAEFKAVLDKYGVTDSEAVMNKLMVSDGAEFTIEVDRPGMQHLKGRVLAFIPDAELAPFMRKNLYEVLNSYAAQATRRAEWARRFKDDSQGVRDLLMRAEREGATPEQIQAAQKYVRGVDGTLGDTISPEARRLMGNMIVYQNIRLLPLAIFSSVVDPMGIMVRGGSLQDSFNAFKRGMRETVKNFKKAATDDDMTKLAASIGVIDDATLTHALGAVYSQGMVGDTGRKINDTFFRYNLMEQFGISMRVGAMEAAMGFLAKHADGTASKHSVRWLRELGLQPGDVKLDAQGRVDVTDPKMKMAVNRWVDGAVLRPDAADKPVWMNDPHWALIAHLKQFVFSFHETILKRVGHEFEHGNYAPAMALTSYVPIMIAADLVKGMVQGGGEQPEWKDGWTLGDYVMSGVERAGLLGTGQFLTDAVQDVQRGGSGVGALLGPTVEQLTDAVRVLGGNAQFDRFAIKSMPANALYAEAFDAEPSEALRE